MLRRLRSLSLIASAVALSACFHAVVETGRPAGSKVVDHPWAMSYIDGLISPGAVSVASDCPGGVSRVETQHSFLNMLVGALTFGLVTPMQITVTCAGGTASISPAIRVEGSATNEQKAAALAEAAQQSARDHAPVYVQF